jgi:hypothetical protein
LPAGVSGRTILWSARAGTFANNVTRAVTAVRVVLRIIVCSPVQWE